MNETALFELENELKTLKGNIIIEYQIINITDKSLLKNIFEVNKIDFIFHAAAYKHVPMMERSPKVAILNNLTGTSNLVDLAIKHQISKFLLVSTDKAVNPSNIMGASKRLCEIYISFFNNGKTKFITTRFGNVIGSNGSVIPIFQKQIEKGGPVTVTHKKIERFFMNIPEASKLVLEACRLGENNQIFIFDMGKPIKIYELAKRMIHFYNKKSKNNIKIKIVGLRPGEKLYEELLKDQEGLIKSKNKHLFIAKKENFDVSIKSLLYSIIEKVYSDDYTDLDLVCDVKKIIPEFKSMNSEYKKLDS